MDLRSEIENRTKAEVEKLLSRAQRVKQREIESALVRKQELFSQEKEKIDRELEKKIKSIKSNLELEYKLKFLNFRDQLINQLFQEVTQELHNFPRDERYLSFLKKIIREAENLSEFQGGMIIFLNSSDLTLFQEELQKETGEEIVKFESADISGGIIIKAKRRNVKIDASFDNLLVSLREDLREPIISELQNALC